MGLPECISIIPTLVSRSSRAGDKRGEEQRERTLAPPLFTGGGQAPALRQSTSGNEVVLARLRDGFCRRP